MIGRLKRFIKKLIRKTDKFLTLKIIFPLVYKWHAKKPVDDNKVIFVEIRLKGVSNSFSLLYDRIKANPKFKVHVHNLRLTFVKTLAYDKRCIQLMKDMATAKYVFLNEATNAVSSVKKREETTVFQTWHGCGAFKKFGFSTAQLIFGENEKNMLRYPFYNNLDYVSVSSPEIVWAYEEALNSKRYNSKIVPIGVSRSDIYYDEEYKNTAYERLYEVMPAARGKKVIVYAPTFRGRVANAKTPNVLNVELLNYVLSDEYVLLFKHHPLVRIRPSVPETCQDFALDVTDTMSIEDLLIVADLCISDYSSLVFEYSLLEKPILMLAYDVDNYIDWRGFYYSYDELVPGPVVKNTYEVLDFIRNIENYDREKVHNFREKFMSSCDGHSTDRIIELVFGENF